MAHAPLSVEPMDGGSWIRTSCHVFIRYARNSVVLKGKVKMIKKEMVQFQKETNLNKGT